jgi:hypothetical protein
VIEGTTIDMMGERIVPSIRRVSNQPSDGGLEAHKNLCVMKFTVLPISPYK